MPQYDTTAKYDLYAEGTTLELGNVDGNYIFTSLRGWSNKSILRRLQITAETTGITGNVDIRVLKNPGVYRSAVAPANEFEVVAAFNDNGGAGAPSPTWKLDYSFSNDGVFYEDDLLSNTLHLMIENESLSAATSFIVRAWGDSVTDYSSYFNHDHNSGFAYWRNDTSDSIWTNLGSNCSNHTYTRSANTSFTVFDEVTTDQYFYIGAYRPFNKVYFDINSGNTTQTTLVAEYYKNDATWASLTLSDNTDAFISGSSYPLAHSGVVAWTIPTDYAIASNPITTGTPPDSEPRYWVRFGLDDIATTPTFYAIRVMPHIIGMN
jgi:hypothetical protein